LPSSASWTTNSLQATPHLVASRHSAPLQRRGTRPGR
jgi:hypothetical protein